jgi:uncharacterized membrane protein (UPF0182 family)
MRNRKWVVGLVLALIALGFFNTAVILWVDWLWFQDLGYPVLFTKSLVTQVVLFAVSGIVFFVLVLLRECHRIPAA